jgi:hypothetical protein
MGVICPCREVFHAKKSISAKRRDVRIVGLFIDYDLAQDRALVRLGGTLSSDVYGRRGGRFVASKWNGV